MTYRTTFIASLSAIALVLAAGEASADPGAARGAAVAPARPAFPSFPRSHPHHPRGGFFSSGGGGVFCETYAGGEPGAVGPAPKKTGELPFTRGYDISRGYGPRGPAFSVSVS